jgi:hypothetical protein
VPSMAGKVSGDVSDGKYRRVMMGGMKEGYLQCLFSTGAGEPLISVAPREIVNT